MSRRRKGKGRHAPADEPKATRPSWRESKGPLLQYCLKFCAFMALLYGLSLLPVCQRILAASDVANARLAGGILNLFGENTRVTEATIQSAKFAVTVLPTCSAIEFLLFFWAAVLAFPVSLSRKLPGILVGSLALLTLNQLRIVSLYYVGAHFPQFFETVHENLWGMILIVAEIILCVTWIGWARKNEPLEFDAAT